MRRKRFTDQVAVRTPILILRFRCGFSGRSSARPQRRQLASLRLSIAGAQRMAALFIRTRPQAVPRIVDCSMELAPPAGPGGERAARVFPLPRQRRGDLPAGTSCSPRRSPDGRASSGRSPTTALAARLRAARHPLVLDGPPSASFAEAEAAVPHHSASPVDLRDATCRRCRRRGPRAASPGRPRSAARHRHLRPHRPGAQRPVRRIAQAPRTPAAPTTGALLPSPQHQRSPRWLSFANHAPRTAAPAEASPNDFFPKPYADAVAPARQRILIVIVFGWFSRPTAE